MNNEVIDAYDLHYAVIEGEDERGNPIYGEPIKLKDVESVKYEEEY